jgi:hypothetical protein
MSPGGDTGRAGHPRPAAVPDNPPTAWMCDTCGDQVSVDEGVVSSQTLSEEPFLATAFRIVHDPGCLPSSTDVVTVDLHSHLGADGLALLLAYLSAGPGRTAQPGIAVADMDSFVDLIRRLQTPHYEQARQRFTEPRVAAALRRADRWAPYRPAALRQLLGASDQH